MGNIIKRAGHICHPIHHEHIDDEDHRTGQAPHISGKGQVRVLLTCMDYLETSNPLTATEDGDNVADLLDQCGITDYEYMRNLECQAPAVKKKIIEFLNKCSGDDMFVFYYAGHGVEVPDKDGDEEDGSDEALAYVDAKGQVSMHSVLVDDDFCDCITQSIHPDTRMLIITDCCHSGTIADLTSHDWDGFRVVAMAGCTDSQESGDTGKGGIMTTCLLRAIHNKLDGHGDFNVAEVYNAMLDAYDDAQNAAEFGHAQDISISASPGFNPNEMSWPLYPHEDYNAPN